MGDEPLLGVPPTKSSDSHWDGSGLGRHPGFVGKLRGNKIMGHPRSTKAAVWVVHPPHRVIVRGTVRWGSSLSHSHRGGDAPKK